MPPDARAFSVCSISKRACCRRSRMKISTCASEAAQATAFGSTLQCTTDVFCLNHEPPVQFVRGESSRTDAANRCSKGAPDRYGRAPQARSGSSLPAPPQFQRPLTDAGAARCTTRHVPAISRHHCIHRMSGDQIAARVSVVPTRYRPRARRAACRGVRLFNTVAANVRTQGRRLPSRSVMNLPPFNGHPLQPRTAPYHITAQE
jgi:hypothetical protein